MRSRSTPVTPDPGRTATISLEAVDGEAERAEAATEIAVEIEKAEMQPGAGADAPAAACPNVRRWHEDCYLSRKRFGGRL